MRLRRWLRHVAMPGWWVRRHFSGDTLRAIESAVSRAEAGHRGELRFAVEGRMPFACLRRGLAPRQRAADLFARLGMANTEEASGVLIYVQLADRQVEILADQGIHARVGDAVWQAICKNMEEAFRAGAFEAGALAGIQAVGQVLAEHFPAVGGNPDELPDAPIVL